MDAAAMPPPQLTIYNLPPSPAKWDAVGIFYITFCATWTTLVFSGMAFCWVNRKNPVLRIRGLPLSFASITFLHCYWCLAQITYPIGMTMPIVLAYDIQYFFMGIWFPLGIALFHASNLRFLHVAKLQKQFTRPEHRSRSECNGVDDSWLCRLRSMNYTKRILIFIGSGMVLQVSGATAVRRHHDTMLTRNRRCFSPSACGWLAKSTIPRSASLAPRSAETPCRSKLSISDRAGSGGRVFSGRSSGPGWYVMSSLNLRSSRGFIFDARGGNVFPSTSNQWRSTLTKQGRPGPHLQVLGHP